MMGHAVKLTYLGVLAALAVACGAPERPASLPVAPDAALAKRVDAAIDKALAAQQLVGVAVLIARDGKIVYARNAGFADREAHLPVRDDTVFRLASMSKPIVSVAALALIDRGKLALEDPVTKWLPAFRPTLADGRPAVITVRHLLTHSAGLTYKFLEEDGGPYHQANVSDGLAEPGLGAAANLERLASVPLVFEPGTRWGYGLSIDVLGEVVARAGGRPLPEVVAQLVTGPLAMADTGFTARDRRRVAWPYAPGTPPERMTEPYDLHLNGGTTRFSPARLFDPASFPSGGAGMAGTARDYLRFVEALRTGGAPILTPATAAAARANQIGDLEGAFLGPGGRFGFGFAVIVDPAAAGTARGRGTFGWGGVYGTAFWVDPEARLSVVAFGNVAGPAFGDDFEQAIYAP